MQVKHLKVRGEDLEDRLVLVDGKIGFFPCRDVEVEELFVLEV